MKFRRIQYPGKTLVVSSLDHRYNVFALYFLKLWAEKFREKPYLAFIPGGGGANPDVRKEYSTEREIPAGFFRQWWFFLQDRFVTVVFLNPDHTRNRSLKWAARLAFVKNRAGFAPLRALHTLNSTLPFNTENHHIVHQFKIFFEYLVGEKVTAWAQPEFYRLEEIPGRLKLPANNYGAVAIEAGDPAVSHLLPQLAKFINLTARTLNVVLVIQSHAGGEQERSAEAETLARSLSETMTERAIEKTELVINPTLAEKYAIVSRAVWVTGIDVEILNYAALMGVPGLSVFGPMNERIWQPFATRARVLTGEFACRPCTKFPGHINCTNPVAWQCVSGVSGELMAATLTGMMRRRSPTGS